MQNKIQNNTLGSIFIGSVEIITNSDYVINLNDINDGSGIFTDNTQYLSMCSKIDVGDVVVIEDGISLNSIDSLSYLSSYYKQDSQILSSLVVPQTFLHSDLVDSVIQGHPVDAILTLSQTLEDLELENNNVTDLEDISDAGSGAIITVEERAKLGTLEEIDLVSGTNIIIDDSQAPQYVINAYVEGVDGSYGMVFTNTDIVEGVLSVPHNLNAENIIVQVFDNNSNLIIPANINKLDGHNLSVSFSNPIIGTYRVTVISGGFDFQRIHVDEDDSTSIEKAVTSSDIASIDALPDNALISKSWFISKAGDRVYTEQNYVTDAETLTTSINALDIQVKDNATTNVAVGDRAYTEQNHVTDGETLSESINALDIQVKDNTDLSESNETAIGTKTYTEDNYVTDFETVTESIDSLDIQTKDNTDGLTNIETIAQDTGETTGVVSRTESTLSFDDATRTFTWSPTATTMSYYIKNVKYNVTEKTLVIPDVTGIYWIYAKSDETIGYQQAFSETLIFDTPLVGGVYWNSDQGKHLYVADERHGITMSGTTHAYLHNVMGTQYVSGLPLSNFVIDGDGSSDTHIQFGSEAGSLRDEDLIFSATTISSAVGFPIYWRDGSSAIKFKEADSFPVVYSGDATDYTSGTIAYNISMEGIWSLEPVTDGYFTLAHIIATNDISYSGVCIMMGISEYATIELAREAVASEYSSLSDIPFAEHIPIGSIIIKADSTVTNTVGALIISNEGGGNYIDFRQSDPLTHSTPASNSHGDLTDRGAINGHPQSAITDLSSDLGIITANITTNAENIGTNDDDLAALVIDIATNSDDIITNATAIVDNTNITGDRTYLGQNYVTDNETITASINALDNQVKDNTDLSATNETAIGDRTYTNQNYVTDNETITASINALDTTLAGGWDELAKLGTTNYTDQNYVINDETLTDSVNALDLQLKTVTDNTDTNTEKIGDRQYTEDNYVTDGETLSASIDALDIQTKDNTDLSITNETALGNRIYSGQRYITTGETITRSINLLDIQAGESAGKIGDRQYTEDNYVTDFETLSESIDALDIQVKENKDLITVNDNDITTAMGARTYTEDNYVTDFETVTESINSLDIQTKDNTDGLTNISMMAQDTGETTGVVSLNESTISFDDATRTFTWSPTATTMSYYIKNVKHSITEKTLVLPDVTSMCWIYIDSNETLGHQQAFSPNLIFDTPLVGGIYYNAEQGKHLYIADERHGITMSGTTHAYLHNVMGTQYIGGLPLSNFDIDGDGSSDTHIQFGSEAGALRDEDLIFQLSTVSPTTSFPIMWRDGTSTIKFKEADGFPVVYSGDATDYTGGTIAYNKSLLGTWSLEPVTDGYFALIHMLGTTDSSRSGVWVAMGINEYATIDLAREGVATEISSLTGVPFAEHIPIGSVIVKADSTATNTVGAFVVSTTDGGNYMDFRTSDPITHSTATSNAHGDLTGRDLTNSHPQSAITDLSSDLGIITTNIVTNADNIDTNTSDISDVTTVIGTQTYTEENYVTNNEPLTTSIDILDMKVNDLEIIIPGDSATFGELLIEKRTGDDFSSGNLTVEGDVDVSGSVTQNGNLTVDGDVNVSGNINQIGDRQYTEDNYVTDDETLSESIDALDIQTKDNTDNISYRHIVTDFIVTDTINMSVEGVFTYVDATNTDITTFTTDGVFNESAEGVTVHYDGSSLFTLIRYEFNGNVIELNGYGGYKLTLGEWVAYGVSSGGGDATTLAVWSSNSSGQTYEIDNKVYYGDDVYKNSTGTNTDTTPVLDTANWAGISSSGGGSDVDVPEFLIPQNSINKSITSGSVTLSWGAVEGAVFHIFYGDTPLQDLGGASTETSLTPSHTINGLTNGVAYYFFVKAVLAPATARSVVRTGTPLSLYEVNTANGIVSATGDIEIDVIADVGASGYRFTLSAEGETDIVEENTLPEYTFSGVDRYKETKAISSVSRISDLAVYQIVWGHGYIAGQTIIISGFTDETLNGYMIIESTSDTSVKVYQKAGNNVNETASASAKGFIDYGVTVNSLVDMGGAVALTSDSISVNVSEQYFVKQLGGYWGYSKYTTSSAYNMYAPRTLDHYVTPTDHTDFLMSNTMFAPMIGLRTVATMLLSPKQVESQTTPVYAMFDGIYDMVLGCNYYLEGANETANKLSIHGTYSGVCVIDDSDSMYVDGRGRAGVNYSYQNPNPNSGGTARVVNQNSGSSAISWQTFISGIKVSGLSSTDSRVVQTQFETTNNGSGYNIVVWTDLANQRFSYKNNGTTHTITFASLGITLANTSARNNLTTISDGIDMVTIYDRGVGGYTIRFNWLTNTAMKIRDISRSDVDEDVFYGNSTEEDSTGTMLNIVNGKIFYCDSASTTMYFGLTGSIFKATKTGQTRHYYNNLGTTNQGGTDYLYGISVYETTTPLGVTGRQCHLVDKGHDNSGAFATGNADGILTWARCNILSLANNNGVY